MWRASLSGFIKNNRSSGLSVRIAAFISALLLSLLCGLFYNAWKYEVERIELNEGGWHSRILAALSAEDIETIKGFASVKDAALNEKGTEPAVDIYFRNKKAVFSDTPRIAERLGIPQEKIAYHYELLAMYLLRNSGDTAPRLLFPLFILITLAAFFSLIVIIHNAFAVSMNARVHQLGILSSVGATPKQIRSCLLGEAFALCAGPVLAGDLLGIAGSAGLLHLSNVLPGGDIPGRHSAAFGYHPLVLVATLLVTAATIWISAWLPARRLGKPTPLEAIKNTGELQLKRKKSSRVLSLLFGVEGELAGNALKAQRKALRTASLSLLFAFLAFALMQCVFTLSQISTWETYFAHYQDVWDIMATIKDTDIGDFEETAAVQALDGVESAVVYQRAAAKRIISEGEMSEAMKSLGGFSHASAGDVTPVDGGFLVSAPIVILDDASFAAYCERLGIAPRLDGAVILNRIRDVTNPDFRHPVYMPYLKGENAASVLRRVDGEETAAEIPVLTYTKEVPALREEYAKLDYYELVHFIPASLWKEIEGRIGGCAEGHLRLRPLRRRHDAGRSECPAGRNRPADRRKICDRAGKPHSGIRNKPRADPGNARYLRRILRPARAHRHRQCVLEYIGLRAPKEAGIRPIHVCGHDAENAQKNVLHRSAGPRRAARSHQPSAPHRSGGIPAARELYGS